MSSALTDNEIESDTLSIPDSVRWALPLLKEYAQKLNVINERSVDTLEKFAGGGTVARYVAPIEALRLFHSLQSIVPQVESIVRQASGLLEHNSLPFEQDVELKLRLEEVESQIVFSRLLSEKMHEHIKGNSDSASIFQSAKNSMNQLKHNAHYSSAG